MGFEGLFEGTIDAKGRLNVPAELRDVVRSLEDEKLMVTTSKTCVEIIPIRDWERFKRKFSRLPQMKKKNKLFRLYYINSAQAVSMDKQNRVRIPPNLRKRVGIDKDVVVIGNEEKIEIYSAEQYALLEKEAMENFDDISDEIGEEM